MAQNFRGPQALELTVAAIAASHVTTSINSVPVPFTFWEELLRLPPKALQCLVVLRRLYALETAALQEPNFAPIYGGGGAATTTIAR
jgi:hypothetical protein